MKMTTHTPIQYILGKTKFFGLDFIVNEDVFIPRPETEVLVQAAIDMVYELRITNYELRILDLCTGSGNIAISLMVRLGQIISKGSPSKSIPDCKIIASDISKAALDVAELNAELNSVSERIEFIESSLFENIEGEFDFIVCNPPYVARHEFDTLQREVLAEPRMAIDGGEDGLDFYRRIISEAPRFLKKKGCLVMEIGFGQMAAVEEIIEDTEVFRLSEVKKDQLGIDRVVIVTWLF